MKILIQSSAQNKSASIDFYKKAGYQTETRNEDLTVVYDDQFELLLNHASSARQGIVLNGLNSIDKLFKDLKIEKPEKNKLVISPSGCKVFLDMENHEKLIAKERGLFGNYFGLGLETPDFQKSIDFWELLGLKIKQGNRESSYITLGVDGYDLTIFKMGMCPHKFVNPSISFFNGKENNPKIIAQIRKLELPIAEEISIFNEQGIVDNVIMSDPGGIHFFLFNDG